MKKRRANARGKRPHHAMLLTSFLVALILMLTFFYIGNNFNLGILSGSFSSSITGYAVAEDINTTTNETVTEMNETIINETINIDNVCPGELLQNKVLNSDINDSGTYTTCFTLKSGITLDCNYHKISAGNIAVELQGDSAIVKNCIFTGLGNSLKLSSSNNLVKDNIILGGTDSVILTGSNNNKFLNMTIQTTTGNSISLTDSNSNSFTYITMNSVQNGLKITGNSNNNILADSSITEQKENAVMFNNLKGNNSIIKVKISSVQMNSVAVENDNSDDNYILNSDITSNAKNIVTKNTGNVIIKNSVYDKNKFSLIDTNKVLLYETFRLNVLNSTQNPLQNIKIELYYNNKTQYSGSTDINGTLIVDLLSRRTGISESLLDYYVEFSKSGIKNTTIINANSLQNNLLLQLNYPKYSKFNNPATTNLYNSEDIKNVSGLILGNDNAEITWNNKVNVYNQDFDKAINFKNGLISFNASALDQTLNSSANILIRNATCPNTLIILYSENLYNTREELLTNGVVCNGTTDPSCISVNCQNNKLTFKTSHFSSFTYKTNEVNNTNTTDSSTAASADQAAEQPAANTTTAPETTQQSAEQTPQQAAPTPEANSTTTPENKTNTGTLFDYLIPLFILVLGIGVYFFLKKGDNPKEGKKEEKEQPPKLKFS
ncbi:hypothetical protein J4476_05270 [Candidatus Woesearchaeota archaeon]|nr:hypothetical protein [Candidatus Woesearchaeota archaeon]